MAKSWTTCDRCERRRDGDDVRATESGEWLCVTCRQLEEKENR